jgi:hypothetical protein
MDKFKKNEDNENIRFNLRKYFQKTITRENYDAEEKGIRKNIEKYNYDTSFVRRGAPSW